MNTTSKIFVLLTNLFFNLHILNICSVNLQLTDYIGDIKEFGYYMVAKQNNSVEAKVDNLMEDYVKKLRELKSMGDDSQAIAYMENAKESFMARTLHLEPQLKAWYNSLPEEEASLKAQKLLVKPYFREINDITLDFDYQQKINKNPALKKAYDELDEFLYILYITHQTETDSNNLAEANL
jgi:hypothetical protein